MPILDKGYEQIIIEREDGEVIASIANDGDTPIICMEGYTVRLVPSYSD